MSAIVSDPPTHGPCLPVGPQPPSSICYAVQVHEKSILLPLLPITVLAGTYPPLALWTPLIATFSMYPLLHRDGVILAYIGTALLYAASMWLPTEDLLLAAEKHKVHEAGQQLKVRVEVCERISQS